MRESWSCSSWRVTGMRIIHFDIDTLRADHLGCYGYERPTSPVIDAVAADGVRFDNVYASDLPCLPSRTVFEQRKVRHSQRRGGARRQCRFPVPEGKRQGLSGAGTRAETWPSQYAGHRHLDRLHQTFPERHSAYTFLPASTKRTTSEPAASRRADQVAEVALDRIDRNSSCQDCSSTSTCGDPTSPGPDADSFRDLVPPACRSRAGSTRTFANITGAFPDHIRRRRSRASVPMRGGVPSRATRWSPTT